MLVRSCAAYMGIAPPESMRKRQEHGLDKRPTASVQRAMKTLTLHLGMHRCGSTTVQNFLRANREALRQQGIAVLLRPDLKADRALDMRTWHRRLALDPRMWDHTGRLVRRLKAIDPNHIIISEEGLISLMPGLKSRTFYPHIEVFLKRLRPLRSQIDLRLRFIVRRQDRFLESVYAFRLFRGLTDDFETFHRSFPPECFDWNHIAGALERSGLADQTRIAVLEAMPLPRIADTLNEFLDCDLAEPLSVNRGNKSIAKESLPLFLALNRAGGMPSPAERRRLLLPHMKNRALEASDLAQILTPKMYAKVMDLYTSVHSVQFSAKDRADWLSVYAGANAKFFDKPYVDADSDIWP